MNIGDKIKKIRKEKKITQSALAGQRITRNMLSAIENGTAEKNSKSSAEEIWLNISFSNRRLT